MRETRLEMPSFISLWHLEVVEEIKQACPSPREMIHNQRGLKMSALTHTLRPSASDEFSSISPIISTFKTNYLQMISRRG